MNPYPGVGQCTWYCAEQLPFIAQLGNLGDAHSWPGNAAAKGMMVNATPEVGSVACYPPGIDGAGGFGHVAVVTDVSGGSYWVEEQDFPRAGVTTTRHIGSVSPGVLFIHPPRATLQEDTDMRRSYEITTATPSGSHEVVELVGGSNNVQLAIMQHDGPWVTHPLQEDGGGQLTDLTWAGYDGTQLRVRGTNGAGQRFSMTATAPAYTDVVWKAG